MILWDCVLTRTRDAISTKSAVTGTIECSVEICTVSILVTVMFVGSTLIDVWNNWKIGLLDAKASFKLVIYPLYYLLNQPSVLQGFTVQFMMQKSLIFLLGTFDLGLFIINAPYCMVMGCFRISTVALMADFHCLIGPIPAPYFTNSADVLNIFHTITYDILYLYHYIYIYKYTYIYKYIYI